jgi:hypothetical protein
MPHAASFAPNEDCRGVAWLTGEATPAPQSPPGRRRGISDGAAGIGAGRGSLLRTGDAAMRVMWMVRRMGRTDNPLRRVSDRVESWTTTIVLLAIVLAMPWAAIRAAEATYREEIRTNAYEREHRFAVQAVLLEDAAWHAGPAGGGRPPPDAVPARGRWPTPKGVAVTGTVLAHLGQRAGSTVDVWVDEAGVLTGPPAQRSPATDAAMVALLTALAVCGALAGVLAAARRLLNRHRMRAWQREWQAVEPFWSKR